MKKICVITSSRADYGLLSPLIQRIQADHRFVLELVATGTHLSAAFGMTRDEIFADNIPIAYEIPILCDQEDQDAPSLVMGRMLQGMAAYLRQSRPDMAVVLGDRYEIFAVCAALVNARVPIAHLCGGETTQGALDECFRHSITKMAQLHFVTNAVYRKRVIQLGEDPRRVFDTGSTSIENILGMDFLPLEVLEKELSINLIGRPYAVLTFHPVTTEDDTAGFQCGELFAALDEFANMSYIITKSNADAGGRTINRLIDDYASSRENIVAVTSLGSKRYLSLLKYAFMVIGNSSSGIIEAPSFGIPTINIGDRQKGRMQAGNTLNVQPVRADIEVAMRKAFHPQFRERCKTVRNPYGDGQASLKMFAALQEYVLRDIKDIKKEFYDVDFEV